MSKSNINEAGWLIPREKNMPLITGDAIKYNCIKPYVPGIPEKGYRETELRLTRNYTVCLQEIIFEIESK